MGFKDKLRNIKDCVANSMIYNVYYNEDLDSSLVYLESRDGLDFTGNIFQNCRGIVYWKIWRLGLYVHAKPQVVNKIRALEKNYIWKIDKILK